MSLKPPHFRSGQMEPGDFPGLRFAWESTGDSR